MIPKWHFCDIARSQIDFRFRSKSGRAADVTAMTEFDPKRTAAVGAACLARAAFVFLPTLEKIVPNLV